MTRALIVIAAFLSLAGTAALAAPPADRGKPESPGASASAPAQSADANAAKKCKAERALGEVAFRAKYGTNQTKANAFGKCVSKLANENAKAEDDEDQDEGNESKAEENAAKKCKAERALGEAAFKAKYGTNHNKANAFGKCVSKLAKAQSS